MKWRVSAILFAMVCFVCVSSAYAFDKGSAAPAAKKASPISCWEPGAEYSTTLDTLIEMKKGNKSALGFTPFFTLPRFTDINLSGWSMIPNGVAGHIGKFSNSYSTITAAFSQRAYYDRPDRSIFSVVKVLLFAILLILMSTVILVFRKHFCDGGSDRTRAAILGYVLSVDLGFVLFGFDGFWTQDRVWNGLCVTPGSFLGASPELAIVVLVACAWYRFLRQAAVPSNRQIL